MASISEGAIPGELVLHPKDARRFPYVLRASDHALAHTWISCLQKRLVFASQGLAPLLLQEWTLRAGLTEEARSDKPTLEVAGPTSGPPSDALTSENFSPDSARECSRTFEQR
jgi:hypothetical protein